MHDISLLDTLDIFARAGGGGSSSGGGTGGGGGEIIALISYVPSYYLGKLIKYLLPRSAELIVSATFATIFSILLLIIGMLGGFFGFYLAALLITGIWAGWAAAFFNVTDKMRARAQKTKKKLDQAALTDSAWNEAALLDYAKQVFIRYQYDWSTFNSENMANYLTVQYAHHASLMLSLLQQLGRKNIMKDVEIKNTYIVDMHDYDDNSLDTFTVGFEAKARDSLIEIESGNLLFSSNSVFYEYWTFQRDGNSWRLSGIEQHTANKLSQRPSLISFANANNMYYSLDMGWLFLPKGGELFKRASFGKSDINNHIVGTYNNHLVQFYTLDAMPGDTSHTYVVSQIILPKHYGGILIRPKQGIAAKLLGNDKAPKGYTKYSFEWPDFNKRYSVYATDADRLAAFELLNPSFMAYLYDTDSKASIEVVDNTVYLYKLAQQFDESNYSTFLTIMLKAFKELKL
jgi:hypothetical protein